MALTLDFSADPATIWDNPESVTLTSVRNAGNVARVVSHAIRQSVEARELAASFGAYSALDVHWFLPGVELDVDVVPKAGDLIQDGDATVWTVLSTAYEDLDKVYDLVCRDPVIVFDLQDVIDVLRPLNTQDASAGRVPEFVTRYEGIAAKIQEVTSDIEERHGGMFRKRTYQVYLGQRLTVRPEEDLVRLMGPAVDSGDEAAGDLFEILDSTKPDLIGELQWLTCRRRG